MRLMTAPSSGRRNRRGRGFPGCGSRRDRAHLDEAEAERQHRVGHLGVLVEAGGEADRDWRSADPTAVVARIGSSLAHAARGSQAGAQRADRQPMRPLRLQPADQRARPRRNSRTRSSLPTVGGDERVTRDRLPARVFRFAMSRRALRSAQTDCRTSLTVAGPCPITSASCSPTMLSTPPSPAATSRRWTSCGRSRRDVTCIHPGWAPLIGRDSVMQSWHAILSNPGIAGDRLRQRLRSRLCATSPTFSVTRTSSKRCSPRPTSSFAKTAGWKMVHHHAGPAPSPPFDPAARQPLQ